MASKKNKKKRYHTLDSLLPEYADNPFADNNELTFSDRFLHALSDAGGTDAKLDFSEVDSVMDESQFPSPFRNDHSVPTPQASANHVSKPAPVTKAFGKAMEGDATFEYDIALHIATNFPTGLYQGIPYIKIDDVDVALDARLVGSLIEKSMDIFQKRKVSANSFKYIFSWLQAILDGRGRTLERDPNLILFENGCFDLRNGRSVPLSQLRSKFFPVKIQASYYPDQAPDTPVWDSFLMSCSGADPQISRLILEYLAYLLAPCEPDQVILLAPAAGSGKSVLGSLSRRLLSYEKTCAISLANFGKAFEVAQIYGKVGNFCLDISSAVLSDATVAAIKRLTGGTDPETINAKYRDPFPYINYAKLIFACNEGGIRLRNPDSGFERRLVVVPFLHSVPRNMMDKHLSEKLWNERNGIIWHAMNTLKALHRNSYNFSYCKEGEILKRKYMGTAEPSVQDFIDEACVLSPEEREWTSTLYDQYIHYCHTTKQLPVGRKQFSQMLFSIPGVRHQKFQKDHIQLQGADGISLKNSIAR